MPLSSGSVTQTLTITKRVRTNKKRRKQLNSLGLASGVVAALLLTLYVAIAALIKYSYWVQTLLIYIHFVRTPFFADLSNPAEFGLRNARNFHLVQHDGCSLGVWHVLPNAYQDNVTRSQDYLSALADGATVVLYLHGNTGSRGTPNRINLYKSLAERGYHVITFDYRGFGESSCAPSERGMMEDALLVWNWIHTHTPSESRAFIWGHSLGSAAATYLAKEVWNRKAVHPKGVVLDAPFTTVVDAAANHPLSAAYWPVLPLFRYFVIESFNERFDSESRLRFIPFPVLIAHGHNDVIIPFHLGYQMYQTILESRKKNPLLSQQVHFVDCGESLHNTNIQSRHLRLALDHFIDGK